MTSWSWIMDRTGIGGIENFRGKSKRDAGKTDPMHPEPSKDRDAYRFGANRSHLPPNRMLPQTVGDVMILDAQKRSRSL